MTTGERDASRGRRVLRRHPNARSIVLLIFYIFLFTP